MTKPAAIEVAETVLTIEPHCEHCPYQPGETIPDKPWSRGFLIEMKPGPDGKPWYLCTACWLDGLTTQAPKASEQSGRVLEVPSLPGTEGDPRCKPPAKSRKPQKASA